MTFDDFESSAFPALRDKLHEVAESSLSDIADQAVAEIKERLDENYPPASAPGESPHKRSGGLQESVRQQTDQVGDEVVANIQAGRGDGVAGYLEHGTTQMGARPFLGPTMNEWRDRAVGEFSERARAKMGNEG